MIAVDLFAGGGGASEGIRRALGVAPVVAVNHDPDAIAMHAANHPSTLHFCESVFDVRPHEVTRGQHVDLLWASPDCCHFSKAKGGKPLDKKIRGLAWVVTHWAAAVAPRVICCENVPEFTTWGPLDDDGQPIPERAGETFREWVSRLEMLGYRVEWRNLVAADYGAPTSRERLFVVARRDGRPIAWPAPTHGPDRPLPWRTAGECIDWSLPMHSIFMSREEARAQQLRIKRPLEEATLRRISEGLRRYVLENPEPYLVELPSGDRLAPWLINTRNGERKGQAPRVRGLDQPWWTITAQGSQGAVIAAFIAKNNGSGERWNAAIGQPLDEPMATITATDTKALVAAFLTVYYSGGGGAQGLDVPMRTIVSHDRFGLVTVPVHGQRFEISDIRFRMLTPPELARAQGFSAEYVLTGTKKTQTARIGNSVCPPVAEALVRAQFEGERPAGEVVEPALFMGLAA